MRIAQNTFPTATIISLQDAKDHLRVTSTAEDSLITDCIKSATEFVERYTGHKFQSCTYTAYLDLDEMATYTPMEIWECYPITAITSVQYLDTAGATQTLSSSNYSTDVIECPARLYFTSFPSVKSNTLNTIRINFTAGYTSKDLIPAEMLGWVKIMTAFFYETRQSEYVGNTANVTNEIRLNYQRALDKYRVKI